MSRVNTLDEIEGDVMDVRDLIARFEELETDRENLTDTIDTAQEEYNEVSDEDNGDTLAEARKDLVEWNRSDDGEEFAKIKDLLESLQGYGGDEQWRGSWYPLTLIADSYFTDYCEELVKDIGDLPHNIPGYLVIDWEATANNLKVDYSSVDFNGNEYWYR